MREAEAAAEEAIAADPSLLTGLPANDDWMTCADGADVDTARPTAAAATPTGLLQAEAIDFCQLDSARLASVNEILAVYLMAHKFGVPVCPHAGGVGLCELVQHLSIVDYVAVSADLTDRVVEYVDHLHEHFVDPCVVRDGAYRLPTAAGYSAEVKAATLASHAFPDGSYWASR